MAYIKDTYELGEYMAYEYKFVGRNGAKGEKREKRRKATPEQMARQNQWTRQKKMTYTIRANFKSGDSWITLKYPRGTKPDPEMMKKHWKSFSDKLREYYKKNGHVLKFILRMEIGKNGGPHMHLLVNHIDNIDQVIKDIWNQTISKIRVPGKNYVYLAPFDEEGAEDVAKYLVELPKNKQCEGQLNMFGEEERKLFCKTSSSRNLIRPCADRKKYVHWTMRKILSDGIKPTPGYYVLKDSVKCGINRITGYSYLYYTEKRLGKNVPDPGEIVKVRKEPEDEVSAGKEKRVQPKGEKADMGKR